MLKIIKGIRISLYLFIVILYSNCTFSQSLKIEDYALIKGDTINVSIPYPVIPNLEYTEDTEPFVVCLREKYASSLFDSKIHLEHILLRELYSNYMNVPLDSLNVYSDDELIAIVSDLFRPLFPNGKMNEQKDTPVNNDYLLLEELKVQYIQKIKYGFAEVIKDGKYVWSLKKVNGMWKIYNGQRLKPR